MSSPFSLLTVLCHKFLVLIELNLSIFSFSVCGFGVTFKRPTSYPRSLRFVPMFPSRSCTVLSLKFGPFGVKFCTWHNVGVQIHSFVYGYPVFLAPHIQENVISPWIFLVPFPNSV